MARKPAPPTFRLEHAWQLPDLKAVMLARACAATALDSPSAAHVVTVTRIYSAAFPHVVIVRKTGQEFTNHMP